MPISLSRYVDITSGVGGGSQVATRNLGALIISPNTLLPTGEIISFSSAADVGDYFGTASDEYARALFYFGWVSKQITSPQQLSFWFWNNDAATGSLIFGAPAAYLLSSFTGISSGELDLTLGGANATLTGINLSAAGSLAAVAADIQTAIRAHSAGGSAWTGATVSYDATRGCFDLVSGTTGADVITVVAAGANDLAGPLGWLTGAILSNGTAAQLLTANLNELIGISNNFGSICLNSTFSTLINIEAVAAWNNSLNPNIQFMFSWVVTTTNASAWSAALIGVGGNTGTLQSPVSGEYPEMVPMMIEAATDYTRPNAVQNYMFNQFDLTPSVLTDANADIYDALRINYYGQTQTAGQFIQFYQRGLMMGLAVDPSDQNVYVNEIWFKDALGAALMNLLLALSEVPANNSGRAQVLSTIQSVVNQALLNGTISVGKTLTNDQQLFITEVTGSPTAWQQVQSAGYWVNAVIESFVDSGGATEYKIVYTLVYSKDDVIRLIDGSDVLI